MVCNYKTPLGNCKHPQRAVGKMNPSCFVIHDGDKCTLPKTLPPLPKLVAPPPPPIPKR